MKHIFTSTGSKLIHHPEIIQTVQKEKKGTPISLQVAPTSRCNLNCCFCSNAKRSKHQDLDKEELMNFLAELKYLGLKTVEWTGGGDPTMYEDINFIISFAYTLSLQQGMITNGILVKEKIFPQNLNKLEWLRISMNCLDYVHSVDVPEIRGVLGFSYVMNDRTDKGVLLRLEEHVRRYNPRYVRVVPDCLTTDEQQEENNRMYGKMIKKWGRPYFYQEKVFDKPEHCYWCYFKPFLLHDKYVYPCSSVVLNSGANGQFHKKYRWVKMEELSSTYEHEMESFPTDKCDHCVFKGQNDLIQSIISPEMENFV